MKRIVTRYIVIHCSATKPSADIGADEIDKWHTQRGWRGIGYAAVIRRSGRIEFGRHFDEIGAHVRGHNEHSVGVCMIGGTDEHGRAQNNFTPEQFAGLRMILGVLSSAYPGAQILGHRDLSPDLDGDGTVERHEWLKECPCFDVRAWIKGDEV